jgi:hypothetical protein
MIVAGATADGDEPATVPTEALRQAALRRLMEHGVPTEQAEVVVCLEPKLGDSWLAYLALALASVIDDLTR